MNPFYVSLILVILVVSKLIFKIEIAHQPSFTR